MKSFNTTAILMVLTINYCSVDAGTIWPKSLNQLPSIMDYDIRHGRTYTIMVTH